MRQRVGIAQALLADPQLLIVDEPTAGLDPEERIRFRTLLSQFAGRRTVLLSTHIVDDIAQTCREVAVLARGRLIFRGTVDELTRRAEGQVWSVVTDGPAADRGHGRVRAAARGRHAVPGRGANRAGPAGAGRWSRASRTGTSPWLVTRFDRLSRP